MTTVAPNPQRLPRSIDVDGFWIRLAGWSCRLTADCAAGREALAACFAAMAGPPSPPARSEIQVRVARPGAPRFRVLADAVPCPLGELARAPEWKSLTPVPHPHRRLYADRALGEEPVLEALGDETAVLRAELWPLYVFLSAVWLMLRQAPVVSLHAAVAAAHGCAIVLVGPSGSGKSTLALALHRRGADCFGDEWAFFRLPEGRLHTLPRDLRLRPGGLAALGMPCDVPWREVRPGDPKCVVPLRRPRRPCPADRVALFLLDPLAARPAIHPLSGGEAVRRLVRVMGSGDPSVGGRLEAAAILVNRYPCRALAPGDPDETAALILEQTRMER